MKSVLVIACAGSALLCTPALADPVTEKSRLEVQPAQKAFKQLSIENPLGDIRVEGYDGTAIMIETHKHGPDEDSLERLRVSLVPSADGTVRIATTASRETANKRVARSQVGIDLIIGGQPPQA